MSKKIYHILTISHKHGNDAMVFSKRQALDEYLYGYVKNWWDSEIPSGPIPKGKKNAIDAYFQHVGDRTESEWYSVDTSTLNPKYQ